MFSLVWIERPMGLKIIKSKVFPDREARFKYIMFLEKQPAFDKVIEMRGQGNERQEGYELVRKGNLDERIRIYGCKG